MKKKPRRALTPQQAKLVDEYMRTGNQNESARTAGYTESSAQNIWRTFKIPRVAEEIQRRLDEEMTAREVLHRLGKKARESADEQVQLRALELIGKKHKLFTDRVEASGDNGGPISIRIVRDTV